MLSSSHIEKAAIVLGTIIGVVLMFVWFSKLPVERDRDGDKHLPAVFGGDDCDDYNPDRFPGNKEIPGDGIDQDCDGEDAPPIVVVEPSQQICEKARRYLEGTKVEGLGVVVLPGEIATRYKPDGTIDTSSDTFTRYYSRRIVMDRDVQSACLFVAASAEGRPLKYSEPKFKETVYLYFVNSDDANAGHLSFFASHGGVDLSSKERSEFLFDMSNVPFIYTDNPDNLPQTGKARVADILGILRNASQGKTRVYFGGFVSSKMQPSKIEEIKIFYEPSTSSVQFF